MAYGNSNSSLAFGEKRSSFAVFNDLVNFTTSMYTISTEILSIVVTSARGIYILVVRVRMTENVQNGIPKIS